jgi:Mrp family chromosome partitioning ATPase
MSKNFELLQQIGNEEELFQASFCPAGAFSAVKDEAKPKVDKGARDALLQKASLPDVFEVTSEQMPPDATAAVVVEMAAHVEVESKPEAAPIASPEKLYASPAIPAALPGLPKPEVRPVADVSVPTRTPDAPSSSTRLLDTIKEGAKTWGRLVQSATDHRESDVEAIREQEISLVQRVFPGIDHKSPRVALFSGLEGDAGCAWICARVGEILAARGEGPVCVVDANFGLPSLHVHFGTHNLKGLADSANEGGPIQEFAQQLSVPNLWFLPSGNGASKRSIADTTERLRARINELRESFRYVVINSGSLRRDINGMVLSRWTDGVVLVVEANATRRDAARRVKENLAAANVKVLGVVLNNRTFPIPETLYRRF